MIPRIQSVSVVSDFVLKISFDDNTTVLYDVEDDINALDAFKPLKTQIGLFHCFEIDQSRTCITWTDEIDLPSDTLKEYGKVVE